MTSYCHIRSRCDLSNRFRKIKVRLIISIMMLDVTNWITRNNLRFAYILLYPKDRQCVIGNDSATRKRFMKFLINITMYSLTQRNYLNNIKLTPWQTYRTLLPNCFSSSHLFMFFILIESRKFVLFQEQLETSVIGLHFCVWLSSKSKLVKVKALCTLKKNQTGAKVLIYHVL